MDLPAVFGLRSFPEYRLAADHCVKLTVNDCVLYTDPKTGLKALFGVGYNNDTAQVFRLYPESDSAAPEFLFLATGRDAAGDGPWEPTIHITLNEDYDMDGRQEIVFYMTSHLNDGPRRLFCVELESFRIEWALDVAAEMTPGSDGFSCVWNGEPAVVFTNVPHWQRYSDSNFVDAFGYFFVVNGRGKLVYNRIGIVAPGAFAIAQPKSKDCFYVGHQIPLADPESILQLPESQLDSLWRGTFLLSKIGSSGEVLTSVEIDEVPCRVWIQTYGPESEEHLYVRHRFGNLSVYDTALNLVARTQPSKIGIYLGSLNMPDYDRNVLVFSDGIYTHGLKKLVHFPYQANYFEPVVVDSNNVVTTLAIAWTNGWVIGDLEKRSYWDMVAVVYVKYRIYVLMVLSGLLAGLVSLNFFRRKARRHIVIISRQKEELEAAHESLKDAQQKIVAQEKFQQAKDIAGGFAHEIRNALFPARSALRKLTAADDATAIDMEKIRFLSTFSDEAIVRAIDLTKQVSLYSNLESVRVVEPVSIDRALEEALEANRLKITELGTTIKKPSGSDCVVEGNHDHLVIVFNNLIRNALDALTLTEDPVILIDWSQDKDCAVVTFSDNGTGVLAEDLDRVFNVFFSTKPDTGTGLGLPMVKKIVEMYNGSMSVENVSGNNVSFHLRLKLSELYS
jgi:signal transduction histidine kinase